MEISALDLLGSMETHMWICPDVTGAEPSPRVGHVCIPVKMPDGLTKIALIGGANPEGCHSDAYIFDPKLSCWSSLESRNLIGRYEFSAFVQKNQEENFIYIFGGTNENGNRNDVQALSIDALPIPWKDVKCTGEFPCPRTQHNNSLAGSYLAVFGGGMCGADPVSDANVHLFDARHARWSKLETRNGPPKVRHGHIMIGHGDHLYIHGGMAGSNFFDDMHFVNLKTGEWKQIAQETVRPSARAAHGGLLYQGVIYVFGGVGTSGTLGDFWMYNISQNKWTEIEKKGAFPSARLDFALCLVEPNGPYMTTANFYEKDCLNQKDQNKAFIFLNGGMDTSGNVFNDTFLCPI